MDSCLEHFEFKLRLRFGSKEVAEADLHSSQGSSDKLLQYSTQGCRVFEMDDLRWIKEDSQIPRLYKCYDTKSVPGFTVIQARSS